MWGRREERKEEREDQSKKQEAAQNEASGQEKEVEGTDRGDAEQLTIFWCS